MNESAKLRKPRDEYFFGLLFAEIQRVASTFQNPGTAFALTLDHKQPGPSTNQHRRLGPLKTNSNQPTNQQPTTT
ncbi:MAG: hypothetical protein ACR2OZ_08095, partial [Verrucomicrobiales bacterium]